MIFTSIVVYAWKVVYKHQICPSTANEEKPENQEPEFVHRGLNLFLTVE